MDHSVSPPTAVEQNSSVPTDDWWRNESSCVPFLEDLGEKYHTTFELHHLDSLVQQIRDGLCAIDDGHPCFAILLQRLGSGLYWTYQNTEKMEDLEEAIKAERRVLSISSICPTQRDAVSYMLGQQLADLYLCTGDISHLEEAILFLQTAVDKNTIPRSSKSFFRRIGNFGIALKERYYALGSEDDFEAAERAFKEAVILIPDNHDQTSHRLFWLKELAALYDLSRRNEDCRRAIQLYRDILCLVPEDDPETWCIQGLLATRLEKHHRDTGDISALDECIELTRIPESSSLGDGNPLSLEQQRTLALRLKQRYQENQVLADLDESIALARRCTENTPRDDPYHAVWLYNLAVFLCDRYDHGGQVVDLEESTHIAREIFLTTPEEHVDFVTTANLFTTVLSMSHNVTGVSRHQDEAISILRRAIRLGGAENSEALHNLAVWLHRRFDRTQDMADVDESIILSRRAIALSSTGIGDEKLLLYVGALVNSLGLRFSELAALKDCEEGIQLARQTIYTARGSREGTGSLLYRLAALLHSKFQKYNSLSDLEEAIILAQRSISLMPEESPRRAIREITLSSMLMDRFSLAFEFGDAIAAFQGLSRVRNMSSASFRDRITAATQMVSLFQYEPELAQVVGEEAVLFADSLANVRSLHISDIQRLLTFAGALAGAATTATLQTCTEPAFALGLLEVQRGLVWKYLLGERDNLLELQEKCPRLADEYIRLRGEVDRPAPLDVSRVDNDIETSLPFDRHRRRKASEDLDRIVSTIRQQPGLNGFLVTLKYDIIEAAERGPVAVINISPGQCSAILLQDTHIWAIPLDGLSEVEINNRAKSGNFESTQTLEWLWDSVTGLILEEFGFTAAPSGDVWPHVWWIPTGPLSRFPLHASGYHKVGCSNTVMDRVVSSYATSVKHIIRNARRPIKSGEDGQALIVGMENTPGASHLPHVAEEVKLVRDLCETMSILPRSTEPDRKDMVLLLESCRIFHFAGHGVTDSRDPLKSHLCLRDIDDHLTVDEVLRLNLERNSPFLAYLSACGTGRIEDDDFVDHGIHLISSYQLAGFRHVIGTLWEVRDAYCAEVARIVYESMGTHGLTDDAVSHGLHKATRTLRDRWLQGIRDRASYDRIAPMASDCSALSIESAETTHAKQVGGRSARNIVMCDDEEEADEAFWIPYVHYGV